MKLVLVALVALPSLALSSPKCSEGDFLKMLPAEQQQVARALGSDWLKNAVYCDFGAYQVITSADPKSDAIMVIRNGKPFVYYEPGFGISLIQDLGTTKAAPYVTVQDWNHDGKFERLDYLLTDADGNIVGSAKDKAMTGVVEVRHTKPEKAEK